jgi:lipopolysaccharide/colanic/teichoic acid biosynthesis glycosyltransferase
MTTDNPSITGPHNPGYPRAVARPAVLDFATPAELPRAVRIVKRLEDVLGAGLGLILLAPVLLLVAVAVKLSSPGPVLYRQRRTAWTRERGETTFWIYKFRTMHTNAEAMTGPTWASEDDPRITRVGRFLRKTRLDELPQLVNVLVGQMSLIGPRPERPFFVRQLIEEIPGYEDRIKALKPGLSGLAQVSCDYDSSVESVRQKLLYDLTYLAHAYQLRRFLWMELRILVLTLLVIVTRRGAR